MRLRDLPVTVPHSAEKVAQQIRRSPGYSEEEMGPAIGPTLEALRAGSLLGQDTTAVRLAAALVAALDDYYAATRRIPSRALATVLVKAFVGNTTTNWTVANIATIVLDRDT